MCVSKDSLCVVPGFTALFTVKLRRIQFKAYMIDFEIFFSMKKL